MTGSVTVLVPQDVTESMTVLVPQDVTGSVTVLVPQDVTGSVTTSATRCDWINDCTSGVTMFDGPSSATQCD